MIDERSRRRPDFAEGVPVTLADGQVWHLRRPRLTVAPAMDDDSVSGVKVGLEGLPDFDGMAAVLCGEVPAAADHGWSVRFQAGVALLRANYELAAGELQHLLAMTIGDPRSEAAEDAIVDTFLGRKRSPKVGPVTSSERR